MRRSSARSFRAHRELESRQSEFRSCRFGNRSCRAYRAPAAFKSISIQAPFHKAGISGALLWRGYIVATPSASHLYARVRHSGTRQHADGQMPCARPTGPSSSTSSAAPLTNGLFRHMRRNRPKNPATDSDFFSRSSCCASVFLSQRSGSSIVRASSDAAQSPTGATGLPVTRPCVTICCGSRSADRRPADFPGPGAANRHRHMVYCRNGAISAACGRPP